MRPAPGSVGLGVSAAAVLAAVVAGLFAVGSPRDERARRLDGRRVTDLQGIARATDLFWTRHTRLPASLDELAAEPGVSIRTSDPTSLDEYGYRPLDSLEYEVCAHFDRPSEGAPGMPEEAVWSHGSGRQCFPFEAEAINRNELQRMLRPGVGEPPPVDPQDPGG